MVYLNRFPGAFEGAGIPKALFDVKCSHGDLRCH